MHIDYPFHFDSRGRTAETGDDPHLRDMIEQVLFTTPGERVNRPEFGSGLRQLIFAPNSPELAATVQYLAQAALQQYLGNLIQVNNVEVVSDDALLEVTVRYMVRRTQQPEVARFQQGGASGG